MENKNIGIETWGGGSRSQKAKPSKLSLVTKISSATNTKSLDITNLSIKELQSILKLATSGVKVPKVAITSRLKKPYIAVLEPIMPDIQLSKLSVSALQELIGAFNE